MIAYKTYSFKIAAINSFGASNFSLIGAFTTSKIFENCRIIYNPQFVQEPINYIIGSTAVLFKIPTYTLSDCPSEKYIKYWLCQCKEDTNGLWKEIGWIDPSGGRIEETENSMNGSYTCYVSTWTENWIDYNGSFTFSLEMSLPTPPELPINLMILSSTSNSINFSWSTPI